MRGVPNVGHSSCTQRVHSVVDVVRRAIEALLADVVRVGVLTPLNHLERTVALPLCFGDLTSTRNAEACGSQNLCFRVSWFGTDGQKTLAS